VFARRDPRRLQPLADHVIDTFKKSSFNSESSFEALKVLNMFRVLYLELSTKFRPWLDETMNHFWPEIQGEHDDVCFSFLFLLIV
jgi:proteasome activator subunit 4